LSYHSQQPQQQQQQGDQQAVEKYRENCTPVTTPSNVSLQAHFANTIQMQMQYMHQFTGPSPSSCSSSSSSSQALAMSVPGLEPFSNSLYGMDQQQQQLQIQQQQEQQQQLMVARSSSQTSFRTKDSYPATSAVAQGTR
jgi:hypothetical protein